MLLNVHHHVYKKEGKKEMKEMKEGRKERKQKEGFTLDLSH
jgi:hypothetical protein